MEERILVGCDPEIFVTRNGSLVSAHGLIPGTKKKPHPVLKGAVQIDGMALEFNIDPATCLDEFCTNVRVVSETLKAMVPDHEFLLSPAVQFSEEEFMKAPEEAKMLGCDPDFDAWEMCENYPPNAQEKMRTASGHVHVGWTKDMDVRNPEHFFDAAVVARQLDLYLGCPSVLWDSDNRRRSLYGKAGAFRPKPYGSEYRVLSNSWLRSRELTEFVYTATVRAMDDLKKHGPFYEKFPEFVDPVRNSINSGSLAPEIQSYLASIGQLPAE